MIERYTRKEMGDLWTASRRFHFLLQVEKAVAQVQGEMNLIPQVASKAIQEKAYFSMQQIIEIEQVTKHDVVAFVNVVAESVGEHGKYLHYGLTSSDVLDTALSLQIGQAYHILEKGISRLEAILKQQSQKHAQTLCAGRTHGMHAQPTTYGLKLAGHFCELRRQRQRLETAIYQCLICKLSGAVGTYTTLPPAVENKVAHRLNLKVETVATQVVPRDRHLEVILALTQYGLGIERLAIELRHLQRTEVGEVCEGFEKGQQGSSAMPHKKNPITGENLTGIARLLRGYTVSALENTALWHERDISHSCVERVIFPDSFILLDYAIDRMTQLLSAMKVDPQRMKANMDISRGQMFSSYLLLALVKKGYSRQRAYTLIQQISHSLQKGEFLKQAFQDHPEGRKFLNDEELEVVFSGQDVVKNAQKIIDQVLFSSK